MGEPADRDLLRRAAAGDSTAFGAIFQRHATAVYNHCFRQLGTWSAAEDATSVVFLEAWRRRQDVRDLDGSLLPWLLGVANNVVRNQARALRRHRAALERLPPGLLEPDHADRVAERLEAEQQMRVIRGQVHQLNPLEQEALALCVWAELSYAQAAVALGVPVATVRSRLARARTRLRELNGPAPLDPSPHPTAFVAPNCPE